MSEIDCWMANCRFCTYRSPRFNAISRDRALEASCEFWIADSVRLTSAPGGSEKPRPENCRRAFSTASSAELFSRSRARSHSRASSAVSMP